jgi:NDP-sugar pyrophosphorylase family protein
MTYIDYGLLVCSRDAIAQRIPAGKRTDLGEVLCSLSTEGLLAGFEVQERFYEIGSPSGLADLESFLSGNAGPDRVQAA